MKQVLLKDEQDKYGVFHKYVNQVSLRDGQCLSMNDNFVHSAQLLAKVLPSSSTVSHYKIQPPRQSTHQHGTTHERVFRPLQDTATPAEHAPAWNNTRASLGHTSSKVSWNKGLKLCRTKFSKFRFFHYTRPQTKVLNTGIFSSRVM